MDKTQKDRQQKYHDSLLKKGFKPHTFYLSEETMAVILQHQQKQARRASPKVWRIF